MSQGKPFQGIAVRIKDAFNDTFSAERAKLVRDVTAVFDRILKDFDLSFVVKEHPNPQRDQLRREMSQFVTEARAELDENIKIELANAETDSANERRNYA